MDNVAETLYQVMIMPLERVFVLLANLEVWQDTSLLALIIIGILFSILIGIVMHSHGFDPGNLRRNLKGD